MLLLLQLVLATLVQPKHELAFDRSNKLVGPISPESSQQQLGRQQMRSSWRQTHGAWWCTW